MRFARGLSATGPLLCLVACVLYALCNDGNAGHPTDVDAATQSDRTRLERLAEIGAADQGKALRVAVEGGCSGFQYQIDLDAPADDDMVLEGAGEWVIDSVLLPFLADAMIDFTDELIGARFVIENPNASSSCMRHLVLNVM